MRAKEIFPRAVGSLALSLYLTGVLIRKLVRPTSRCILFDGENVSIDSGLVIYEARLENKDTSLVGR